MSNNTVVNNVTNSSNQTPKQKFLTEKVKGRLIYMDKEALDRLGKDIGSIHLSFPEAIWEVFLTRDDIIFERYSSPNPRQKGIGEVGDQEEERKQYSKEKYVDHVFYLTEKCKIVAIPLAWEKEREDAGLDALYVGRPPHDQIQIREVWNDTRCVRHTDLMLIDSQGKAAYRRSWPCGFSKDYDTKVYKLVVTCYFNERNRLNTTAAYCEDLEFFRSHKKEILAFLEGNSNKNRERF